MTPDCEFCGRRLTTDEIIEEAERGGALCADCRDEGSET